MGNKPELTENQQALLQAVFDHFNEKSDWPSNDGFIVQFRKRGGFWKIAESLGNTIIEPGQKYNKPSEVKLTIKGIWLCNNSDQILAYFMKALKLCVERFISKSSEPKIGGEELYHALGRKPLDHRRLYLILQGERNIWTGIQNSNPMSFEMSLSENIINFEDINNIEEYIDIQYPQFDANLTKQDLHNEVFNFDNMSFNLRVLQYLPELIADNKLKNVIIQDSNELSAAIQSASWKCVCILCGSVCETILLDHLQPLIPTEIKELKTRENITLKNLLDKAIQREILPKYIRGMLDAVREMRNIIHPALLDDIGIVSPKMAEASFKLLEAIAEAISRKNK